MKEGVEVILEAVQRIHDNQVFENRLGISLESLLESTPFPDAPTSEKEETDVVYVHLSVSSAEWSQRV